MSNTYLPEIDASELRRNLLAPGPEFLAGLDALHYERLGLDRALLIAADIALRTGRCNDFSILDVGCNNGLIGRSLGVLGNRVRGIDNGVIDGQKRYEPLCDVEKCDLCDYLDGTSEKWDFCLLLSVAHHWETGYAGNGNPIYSDEKIHQIFERLHERVGFGIYLEMPLQEPGFEPAYTDNFMKKYCSRFDIIEINRTIATNGFLRRLYFLGVTQENRGGEVENILRNAHLYEKMELARLTVPRAVLFMRQQEIHQR